MQSNQTWRSACLHGTANMRAAAATVLLAAALPLSAQPFTRTIANGETVVVPRLTPYGIPVNESLLIESGGELQGRGGTIGVSGLVQNNGRLRAFDDPENAYAVAVSGLLNNSQTGLIEVTSLSVWAGGTVESQGSFTIGGFRINPSDPLTTVCAYLVPCQNTGFTIDAGGLIAVMSGGPMLNYGNAQISGTLNNAGSFVSRNSSNPSGGAPYEQVLTVGKDPIYLPPSAVNPGQVINSGSFELQARNTLRNFASVSNSGSLVLNGGKLDVLNTGFLTNTGNVRVDAGGQLAISGSRGFDSLGNRIASLTSNGNITVADGELINQSSVVLSATSNVSPLLVVGPKGKVGQGTGYGELTLLGGKLLVEGGDYSGYSITIDNLGVHGGGVFIDKDGTVQLDGYLRQIDGTLKVAGSLQGGVQLNGGNLVGTGKINGDVLVRGAGGGPPQQPPNCGNAFYACFRPGNSPGHMDIFGTLTMEENSILELEVERDAAGVLRWDSIHATSASFSYGSTLRLLVAPDAAGADWANLDLIRCESGCSFEGLSYEVVGADDGFFGANGAGGLSFNLAPAAAVPEPGTWALWLVGIAALASSRWRRRGSSH